LISAEIVLDGKGFLKSCKIEGHAGAGKRGEDVVCAAVSVLARTAFRTLSRADGVDVSGEAPARGAYGLKVVAFDGSNAVAEGFLAGTTAFLVEGLSSVARDYPEQCTVLISN